MSKLSDTARRRARIIVVGIGWLAVMLPSALAAGSVCEGVKLELTKAHKQVYAPLVASAVNHKIKPA